MKPVAPTSQLALAGGIFMWLQPFHWLTITKRCLSDGQRRRLCLPVERWRGTLKKRWKTSSPRKITATSQPWDGIRCESELTSGARDHRMTGQGAATRRMEWSPHNSGLKDITQKGA